MYATSVLLILMCCNSQSLVRVVTNLFQGCKVELYVTVGLTHYMVYLGNGLLGTEDEIDCCFSKKREAK